jgi:hypothetical protein
MRWFIITFALLLVVACSTQTVKEIKNETFIGKSVVVEGTAQNTFKIGSLSGFMLQDAQGDSIGVKSESLPKDNTKITVKGTLIKDSLFGYYINAEKIS